MPSGSGRKKLVLMTVVLALLLAGGVAAGLYFKNAQEQGEGETAEKALASDKIDFAWDSVVDEVLGDDTKVHSIRLRNVKTDELTERECGGFFVAIGHDPNTALFSDLLETDGQGYLIVRAGSRTKIDGVFVAGDVHDHTYRQAVTAAGAGCKAAIDCERWLEAQAAG